MKRVVSSSFIALFILLAVAAAFLYFRSYSRQGADPAEAIPSDASFFVVYDTKLVSLKTLQKNAFWNVLSRVESINTLKKQMALLDSVFTGNELFQDFVNTGPLYISAHVTGASEFDFLFLKNFDNKFNDAGIEELMRSISVHEGNAAQRIYDGNAIRDIVTRDGNIFTYSVSKGVFIGSFTSFLVEDALRQQKVGNKVFDGMQTALKNFQSTGIDVFFNLKNIPSLLGVFTNPEKSNGFANVKSFGNWVATGADLHDQSAVFNGYFPEADSTDFQTCFNGQQPVAKELFSVLSSRTALVKYFGLSDVDGFLARLNSQYYTPKQKLVSVNAIQAINKALNTNLQERFSEWMGHEFALVIIEPPGLNYTNNCFAVVHSKNIRKARKILIELSAAADQKSESEVKEEQYNGHTIGFIKVNGMLPALFGDLFSKVQRSYYTIIGNYVIFGNQASSVRSVIDDYKSGSLLVQTGDYKLISKQFPEKGNFLFYLKPARAFYLYKSMASEKWLPLADKYRDVINDVSVAGLQLSASGTTHRLNAAVNFAGSDNKSGTANLFSVDTDSSVSLKPLLTTDSVSKTRRLLFQDDSNTLYYVDNSGNIIWKTDINGHVLSDFYEIDLFKNNSKQFLFNTEDYLFLMDTEGKPVGNYPIRLPARATNGLCLYDFDKNNVPQITIACSNNKVYAYLPGGKPLPGWNFQTVTGKVARTIEVVGFGARELMVVNDDGGGFYLINRLGEIVIPVNRKINIAQHSNLGLDENGELIFTDTDGNIVRINTNGEVSVLPLNASVPEHGFVYADADNDGIADYIFSGRHDVTAYNRNLVMIYRKEFTEELTEGLTLHKLKKGVDVLSVQSKSANKQYLLFMNGTPLRGFPVNGCSGAVIDELNLDGNKNLFVGGSDNRFYVYAIE